MARVRLLWGLIRSTGNPSGSLIYAVGQVRRAHLWNLTLLVVTVPLLWVAARSGGLPALAWLMCGLQVAVHLLTWWFLVLPACGARFAEYNAQLAKPLGATLLAAALALLVTRPLPAPWELPIGAVLFGVAYLALSWWLNRYWLQAMIELGEPLWKRVVARKPGG
jgi:hypothetical protein